MSVSFQDVAELKIVIDFSIEDKDVAPIHRLHRLRCRRSNLAYPVITHTHYM